MTTVDLRSDTVTKPTRNMIEAMLSAKVGDDVFGEDESVNELEIKAAKMFGMEAGIFCPSGTMSNQIAIKCFTQPMDELITDQTAHVYRYEGGGIAFHSGASVRLLCGNRGKLTAQMIEPEINSDNIHYPRTSLVTLENTINKGGGVCYTLNDIEPISQMCKMRGLKLHLDGARIFNAIVHTGDKAVNYGQYFDGISICLSKGLGAPVGSVFLASKEIISQARRLRKVFGGGMRQAGFLAAAGNFALDHHIQRLSLDHINAAVIADKLEQCSWVSQVLYPETNIILFDTKISAREVQGRLNQIGIKANCTDKYRLRFVTHLDINENQVRYVVDKLATIL